MMEAQRMQGYLVAHRAWQAGFPTVGVIELLWTVQIVTVPRTHPI
jgi:hypothetical protein